MLPPWNSPTTEYWGNEYYKQVEELSEDPFLRSLSTSGAINASGILDKGANEL